MAHSRLHRQPGGEQGLNAGFYPQPRGQRSPWYPPKQHQRVHSGYQEVCSFSQNRLIIFGNSETTHCALSTKFPWVLVSTSVWESVWVGECTGVASAPSLRTRLYTMQRKNICIIKRKVILASVLSLILWITSLRWGCYKGGWGSPGFCSCFSMYPKSLCKKTCFLLNKYRQH